MSQKEDSRYSWLSNVSFTNLASKFDHSLANSKFTLSPSKRPTADFNRDFDVNCSSEYNRKFNGGLFFIDSRVDVSSEFSLNSFQSPKYTHVFGLYLLSSHGYLKESIRSEHIGSFSKRYTDVHLSPSSILHSPPPSHFPSSLLFIPLNIASIFSPLFSPKVLSNQSIYSFLQFNPKKNSIDSWLEQFSPVFFYDYPLFKFPNLSFPVCMENILDVFESALSFCPSHLAMLSKFMTFYSFVYPHQQVIQKWSNILFTFPHYSRLWSEYVDFMSHCYDDYFVDDVIDAYYLAFRKLISILELQLISSAPEIDAEKNLVFLVIKYCYFLNNAGFKDRAIFSIFALFEFNSYKATLLTSEKKDLLSRFILKWNTSTSLFLQKSDTSRLCIFEHSDILLSKPENILSDHLHLMHTSWAKFELMRTDSWEFIIQFFASTNNDKYSHYSLFSPILFCITNGLHTFQLLLHALLLLGIPISFRSRIEDTFISENGMIVEIDSKGWVSLSPLQFTGTLIMNSVDTENLNFKNSRHSHEQIKSLERILNILLPLIEFEYHTVILLIWFEFLINCFDHSIEDAYFNEIIRSQIRKVLSSDKHKNNIEIWTAYVILNSYVSGIEDIFKIPIALCSEYSFAANHSEMLKCFYLLLHLCSIVNVRFSISTSHLEIFFFEYLNSESCPRFFVYAEQFR